MITKKNNVKKGRIMYIPRTVLDELNNIRFLDKVESKGEAFHKLVSYSQLGREVQRINPLDKKFLVNPETNKKKFPTMEEWF